MSGIKYYPELDSLKVNFRDKVKRKPMHVQMDPVEERKFVGLESNTIHLIISIMTGVHFYSNTVMSEIEERAAWLAEMEALGEGKEHRPVIMSQIAERLRMVKKLERKRQDKLAEMSVKGLPVN